LVFINLQSEGERLITAETDQIPLPRKSTSIGMCISSIGSPAREKTSYLSRRKYIPAKMTRPSVEIL
jgi:hypothetical protein